MNNNELKTILKKIVFHSVIGSIIGAISFVLIGIVKMESMIGGIRRQAIAGLLSGLLIVSIRGFAAAKYLSESIAWIVIGGLTLGGIYNLFIQSERTMLDVRDMITGILIAFIFSLPYLIFRFRKGYVWRDKNS